jgi:hypothetical protein
MPDKEPDLIPDDLLAEPTPEPVAHYPGFDLDGKERLPLFGGVFASKDFAMPPDVDRSKEPARDFPAGTVAPSPFV